MTMMMLVVILAISVLVMVMGYRGGQLPGGGVTGPSQQGGLLPPVGEWPAGPPILESLLLPIVRSFWALRETKERQVELQERHFSFRQEEMIYTLEQLCNVVLEPLPLMRQQSQGRSATRDQTDNVVNLLEKLYKLDRLACFMVQSDNCPCVLPLLGAVSVGDERGGVSVRSWRLSKHLKGRTWRK